MTATDTAPSIVPDFGDDAEERKICFVCSQGNLDMAYPALIMANGALTEGIEVEIFFTFWGMDMINLGTWDKLQFTMLGNTAMHMPGLGSVLGAMPVSFDYWLELLGTALLILLVMEAHKAVRLWMDATSPG